MRNYKKKAMFESEKVIFFSMTDLDICDMADMADISMLITGPCMETGTGTVNCTVWTVAITQS